MQNDDCLFCKISRGEIPSKKIYEDEEVFAFHDINPAAPVHFLIIPKRHITSLAEVSPEDGQLLGKMLVLAKKLALEHLPASQNKYGDAGPTLRTFRSDREPRAT